MIFYLLLCNILFTPLIFCNNITVSKSGLINETISDSHQEKSSNETKTPLLSEGGSILPETLVLALPKSSDNVTSLGNVMGKNKVVARKGVVYSETATKSQEAVVSSNENFTKNLSTSAYKTSISNKQLSNATSVLKGKTTLLDSISNVTKNANETEPPKKPLILYSDVLESMTVKTPSGTVLNNQLPLNKEVKAYITKSNTNNHPGMVMPIVITILLVPMFAVLGYMALRRGQEAWKNRHYKRMDFLLDGMYND